MDGGERGAGSCSLCRHMHMLIAVPQQTWPVMKAGYKLWPAVNLVQHVFIPVERKTVVGSLVGLGWGVYLALFAAQ